MSRAISVASIMLISSAAFGQATFQGLGYLAGGSGSGANAVSPDGSIVVGSASSASGAQAFRWTNVDGMIGLGHLPGGDVGNRATSVSADGTVVVGYATMETRRQAFRWTPSGGMQGLNPTFRDTTAYAVSANGSVIVGTSVSSAGSQAVRWTGGGTQWEDLANSGTRAFGVSADGSIVVGGGWSNSAWEPMRWFGAYDFEGLGGDYGDAIATSPDASVIVGCTRFQNGSTELAFRWLEARPADQRMERLSDPSELWQESRALDVSADGSVIVGGAYAPGGSVERAFIWDTNNGMRHLGDVLEHDFCLDLAQWNFESATGISDDGLTIVGIGTTRGTSEAWIARISPLAETDRDGDGTPNCADGCPDDPDKTEPGVCGCNVPDVDSDKDGVLDCLDGCPNDPDKTEPGVCGCNAPDVDSDVDGFLDCLDNCPNHYNPEQADCNGDGVGDVCAITGGMSRDCNTNEMPDDCEIAAIHDCCDTLHGPGCNNADIAACVCALDPYCCEQDWDRVCIAHVIDETCGRCNTVSDCDGNSIPDACEPDCNTNEITDACDILNGTSLDCQPNSVPDECDPDFDLDGTTDDCDGDIDDDEVLNENDVCDFTPLGSPVNDEGRPLGDINEDCALDLEDYATLSVCLSISGPGVSPPLTECLDVYNVDDDVDVDMTDVASFQRFFGR